MGCFCVRLHLLRSGDHSIARVLYFAPCAHPTQAAPRHGKPGWPHRCGLCRKAFLFLHVQCTAPGLTLAGQPNTSGDETLYELSVKCWEPECVALHMQACFNIQLCM